MILNAFCFSRLDHVTGKLNFVRFRQFTIFSRITYFNKLDVDDNDDDKAEMK